MVHDHKLTNPERHKKWTGVDNKRIPENFKKDYENFPNVDFIARTPLIPGINADYVLSSARCNSVPCKSNLF
jgi:pyruvate formate lyase activating enzyme